MKFFWVSTGRNNEKLALRLHEEGHHVRWYGSLVVIEGSEFEFAKNLSPDADEIVVFDGPGEGKLADDLRKRGYTVIGSSMFQDALALNEDYSQQIMRAADITATTDFTVEGWFNGSDWIYHSISASLEETRFLTGDLGPVVGSMGHTTFFYRHARPRLARDTILKLTPFLRRVNYTGPIGFCQGRFVPRMHNYLLDLLETEWGKVLAETARGQMKAWKVSFDFCTGITLTVPPYPYGQGGFKEVITATAPQLSESRRLAYEKVREAKYVDVQYRLDIGERAQHDIPQQLREVSNGD